MATAVPASGGGEMVFEPFNRCTMDLLKAAECCLNARAHLNMAAGFSHSLHSCSPKGMIGTLSGIMLPVMVTGLSRNVQVTTKQQQ